MVKPTLYADFNNADRQGRLRLTCRGTLRDLAQLGLTLRDGLSILAADYEGLEADAIVGYSMDEACWVAAIDWDRIRDVPAE